MYFPSIKSICAFNAGNEPKIIKIAGTNTHCKKINILLNRLTPTGRRGRSIVLITAETKMPAKEIVIILPVKIGKLKDSTVKLNLLPPKSNGNQPKAKSKRAAVAHDQ